MNFFLNEILEDDSIRQILLNDKETEAEGKKIAENIIATGNIPSMPSGFLPLFVLGYLADYALEKNTALGISKEITVATLKDVNIWLENYETQHGKKGLGEFCWLKYHYTGDLFRLGRLQFRIEKSLKGVPSGEYAIESHIPQGEPLTAEGCLESFQMAKEFFAKYFPQYTPEYFMCDSWLLNPNLAKVLSEDSNIVKFMRLWTQFPFPGDNSAQAIHRVFGFNATAKDLPNAPENTSLQKKMKAYLLSGGTMEITGGYRKI